MTKLACALAASAAVLSVAAATPATATIIIEVGPGALQPDENLLFNNNPAFGTTIEGVTNQTGTFVTIEGGETLRPAGGQARLDTVDTAISSTFTYRGFANQLVGFDLSDPALAFTDTEFRVFNGRATEVTLTFVDTLGEVFQQTFGIPANGYFSARAIDGQQIDYFSIAANGSLGDVRQIRLGGISSIAVVPEPAVWGMMLLGFGAAGAMLRTRRRLLATA